MKNNRKILDSMLCVIISVMTIFILLITSFEIATYSDYGFYEKEYAKYQVTDDLGMEMKDVMDVTKYMMSYLRGRQDTLSIETTIEGEVKDFFNEQDRFHMGEVQNLFLGGLRLRILAIAIFIIAMIILIIKQRGWLLLLASVFERTLFVFMAIIGILGILIWQNFSKCFVIFHEIFFDNDLWIFDARTDYMIRMLPEGFFYDTVIRIGFIFIVTLLLLLIISVVIKKRFKNK